MGVVILHDPNYARGVALVLIAGCFWSIAGLSFQLSTHDVLLCALLGCVQVGLGLILFTVGSRYIPAGELALLSLTEVVLGPVWVWLGVGEVPTSLTLLGGVIVLSAIVAQAVHGVRRRPPVGVV